MKKLTYTQHNVAFPSVPMMKDWHTDELGVHDETAGGEFYWTFMAFSAGSTGVQLGVFGDGLDVFYDKRIQRVVKKWKAMEERDSVMPRQLIALLEEEGVVESDDHRRGREKKWNEGVA